jgi:hypothetical protein
LARSSVLKTHSIKRNRKSTLKNTSNPRTLKSPKSSPLTHGFGRESKVKEPQRVHMNFPHQIPKSKVLKTHRENHQERTPKITTKNNWEQHNKALRNHAESSIHTKEVHTRASMPLDHPTLSIDLSMKVSS